MKRRPSRFLRRKPAPLAVSLLLASSALAQTSAAEQPAALKLIQQHCVACHNPQTPSAGLDLTTLEAASKGGQHGPAIAPGRLRASLAFQKIAAAEMPLGNPLPQPQRDIIRDWIQSGAPWPSDLSTTPPRPRAGLDWWSLQPLEPSQPPPAENLPEAWSASPIDRFLFARMAEKSLRPAPPADRPTLIRRATFDLIGLPPAPDEVEAFVSDPRPDAYEQLLDRLLASPRYGERWGRHWLDVVRFGESHGFEQNHIRENAWAYRDYVIRSLNRDKPFDRFVIEQLAADQIHPGDPAIEAATGFLVAGTHDTVRIRNLAGRLQQRADDLNDIITATGGAFLGLTIHCARCHDHKFDPIQQTDYYRLQSILSGVRHGERPLATLDVINKHHEQVQPLRDELEQIETQVKQIQQDAQPQIHARRDEILARHRPAVDPAGTEETFTARRAKFVRMRITKTVRGTPKLDGFEIWTSGPAPRNVALASSGAKAAASSERKADDDPTAYSVDWVIDGEFSKRWICGDPDPCTVTIELAREESIARILWSRDRLGAFQKRFLNSVPDQYVIETSIDGESWAPAADTARRLPFAPKQRDELLLLAVLDEPGKAARAALLKRQSELETQLKQIPAPPQAYIGKFEQPAEPGYLMKRGDPMNHGDIIAPASPGMIGEFLPGFELEPGAPEGQRRLAFARWVADPRNPLTPRVIANRLWQFHFGRGIVGTPSDFGYNGLRPTHPALLDYLAARLLGYGWRWKPLHKEIMMSAAYRQSSRHHAQAATIDRDAHYLWRFPPRRLEAEAIRDSILAVSGQLDTSMGGPGFRLYKYTVDNVATYYPLEEFTKDTFRRAVYHQAPRSVKVDLLSQYDCPDPALPAPKREVTTSPLQALTLLNSPFLIGQARFFAQRLRREAHPADAGRQAALAYRLAFGRSPTARERRRSIALIQQHGLMIFCRAILNANEFLYVM